MIHRYTFLAGAHHMHHIAMLGGKVLSFCLSASGALYLAQTAATPVAQSSFGEHLDIIYSFVALLLVILGFLGRGWIAKREKFEDFIRQAINEQSNRLTHLEDSHESISRNCAYEMTDARRGARREEEFRLWVSIALTALAGKIGVQLPPIPEERHQIALDETGEPHGNN